MARFKAKTEEENTAEAVVAQVERARKDKQDADTRAQKQQAAFAASPAGRALAAKSAGRRYFQIVRDVSSSEASAAWTGNTADDSQNDHTGLIESVEDQGWALQDVGYVFKETASEDNRQALGSGERTAASCKVVGVYVFRAT